MSSITPPLHIWSPNTHTPPNWNTRPTCGVFIPPVQRLHEDEPWIQNEIKKNPKEISQEPPQITGVSHAVHMWMPTPTESRADSSLFGKYLAGQAQSNLPACTGLMLRYPDGQLCRKLFGKQLSYVLLCCNPDKHMNHSGNKWRQQLPLPRVLGILVCNNNK